MHKMLQMSLLEDVLPACEINIYNINIIYLQINDNPIAIIYNKGLINVVFYLIFCLAQWYIIILGPCPIEGHTC